MLQSQTIEAFINKQSCFKLNTIFEANEERPALVKDVPFSLF